MAKYDGSLAELKSRLGAAKTVLIALPNDTNLDEMASGAALFLALQSHGKEVQIVSDIQPQVAQANLYGVGSIKNSVSVPAGAAPAPSAPAGDYTLVLEGVATPEGTVPSLEKLDWYAENNNLNLVFHVLPGQNFQPRNVYPKGGATPAPASGNFDVIVIIGSPTLANLGNIYNQNQALFAGYVANIDNSANNTSFGQTNVIDTNVSSISEMMSDIIPALGLPFDRDIATNLLAGIFEVTGNLSNQNVGPDTYTAVGNCVRVGGQKPLNGVQGSVAGTQPQATQGGPNPVGSFQTPASNLSNAAPMMDFSAFSRPPAASSATSTPPATTPEPAPAPTPAPAPAAAPVENTQPAAPQPVVNKPEETFTVPPIASVLPNDAVVAPEPGPQASVEDNSKNYQPSAEERPAGERVVTDSPEPGWLTPKVFKGSSVG